MYSGGFAGKPPSMAEIMFKKFDKDGSGQIDHNEFHLLCFNLGYPITESELGLAVRILDADGSGQIDQKEFKDWWRQSDRWAQIKVDDATMETRKAASEVFKEFDSAGRGVLSTNVSQKLTSKSKEVCLQDLDANRDGKVQFKEYVEWLARQGTIKVQVMDERWQQQAPGTKPSAVKAKNPPIGQRMLPIKK